MPAYLQHSSLVAEVVKNLPAIQETRVQFLGGEDLLEKGMATHSSCHGVTKSWTGLSNLHCYYYLQSHAIFLSHSLHSWQVFFQFLQHEKAFHVLGSLNLLFYFKKTHSLPLAMLVPSHFLAKLVSYSTFLEDFLYCSFVFFIMFVTIYNCFVPVLLDLFPLESMSTETVVILFWWMPGT